MPSMLRRWRRWRWWLGSSTTRRRRRRSGLEEGERMMDGKTTMIEVRA
jgi:hypothetical protein